MTAVAFLGGVVLILTGLASRHEERRALILFGIGALLVVVSGVMALQGLELSPP